MLSSNLLLSLLLPGQVAASSIGTRDLLVNDAVKGACKTLQDLHSDLTFFPNSTTYQSEIINAWDKRGNLEPACVFRPKTAAEVSNALGIFHSQKAQFAVRGGGHLNYPGSNNINDGVLVVLSGLNDLKVACNRESIEVGPGNKWVDVYAALAPHGLYTMGGRLKSIGVPGLTLLGGVSYFLNKYGFTMDNVISYDVVLGNGTLVTANAEKNPDLFWALKGSGSNYGIVTKFVLKTYHIPLVASTRQVFTEEAVPSFIKAVCDMALFDDGLEGAGASVTINYNKTTGQVIPQIFGLQETNVVPPGRFANFSAIPDSQTVQREHNITVPVDWHSQFESPNQLFRISFGHHTILPDAEQLILLYNIWIKAVHDIENIEGFFPALSLNMVPRTSFSVAKANGIGNTFGHDDTESYIWWQLVASWQRPEDDLRVSTWSHSLLERMHSLNKAKGLATEFLYGGDSSELQNPLLTYLPENIERMRQIRDKFDPDLVFTKLNWGGFKLGL